MNKRLGAIAIVTAAVAVAAGLIARPSSGAAKPPNCGDPLGCSVALTGSGPLPSAVELYAEGHVTFRNQDSATHTVAFANGLCSLTLPPGTEFAACSDPFELFVGAYAYTVDGKFPGTVLTIPLPRSVTLTARTHSVRAGESLSLHGQIAQRGTGAAPPPPVVVLARHSSTQPFERVAKVRTRGAHQATYRWKLDVHPNVATTYIAEVTAQRLCYFPASRCAQPQGQSWADARSRPFSVRIRP